MELIVREIGPNDAKAVARLSGQLGYDITEQETLIYLSDINNSANDAAYVAVLDDIIVGWIHVFAATRLESGSFCEIGGLVVDEDQRGKGIGKLLVEQAGKWCADRGIQKLKVRTNIVRKDTHQFYTNIGFKEIKQQKIFEMKLAK